MIDGKQSTLDPMEGNTGSGSVSRSREPDKLDMFCNPHVRVLLLSPKELNEAASYLLLPVPDLGAQPDFHKFP